MVGVQSIVMSMSVCPSILHAGLKYHMSKLHEILFYVFVYRMCTVLVHTSHNCSCGHGLGPPLTTMQYVMYPVPFQHKYGYIRD